VAASLGPTVSDLGEDALLDRILERIGGAVPGEEVWSGDDAACVASPARLLITTDLVVESFDFDLAYSSGFDVGWKAVAVNASDVAAMCGRPLHAVTSVGLRADTPVEFFDDLLDGVVAAARRWGIAVVGGDVSEGREISVGTTLTGEPLAAAPVLRSGARMGDALLVTGTLGAARGGLEVLVRNEKIPGTQALVERQLRPTARVEEAAALAPLGPTAMIDLSDGLAVDLGRLLAASHAGADVSLEALPVEDALDQVPGLDVIEAAVLGGEDFELLFTIGEELVGVAVKALRRLGTPLTRIGTIASGEAMLGGRRLETWRERGWQHLRSR
jgi:thiamine-monophosphate kinase